MNNLQSLDEGREDRSKGNRFKKENGRARKLGREGPNAYQRSLEKRLRRIDCYEEL